MASVYQASIAVSWILGVTGVSRLWSEPSNGATLGDWRWRITAG